MGATSCTNDYSIVYIHCTEVQLSFSVIIRMRILKVYVNGLLLTHTTDHPKGSLHYNVYTNCRVVTNNAVSLPFSTSITVTIKYFYHGILKLIQA